MTKKVKVSFLILVWSIVAIQMYVNYWEQGKNDTSVITAFSVVEDDTTEEWIKGYGYFGTMEISEAVRRDMLENLAQKLGITDDYTFSSGSGDGYEKMMLSKEGRYAATALQIISMEQEDGEPEQYIVMEIHTDKSVADAVNLYQRIKRVYEEIGVEAQVSMEVETAKSGDYIDEDRDSFVSDFLSLMKAKQVDTIKENEIYTVYGYTRLEESFLTLNKKKVNIQLTMSYDEERNKTYIKIGVPIVNSSY
ncbi:MAG: YwmB family TATA-box binding protein [Clostridium sp.]|nr:YwmB family TATA-box binding protein [Clostridium sp.]